MNQYDEFYEQIKDATLEVIKQSDQVDVYRLRKTPNSRMMSADLIFTPGIIVITGDLRITQNGVIALGYDLDWFTHDLDPHYLASKFLKHEWCPDQARAYWRERLQEYKAEMAEHELAEQKRAGECEQNECPEEYHWEEPGNKLLRKGKWRIDHYVFEGTIIDALEYLLAEDGGDEYFNNGSEFYRAIPSRFEDHWWVCPFDVTSLGGYGYAESKVGWLYAIQRRFSECYSQIRAKNPLLETIKRIHEMAEENLRDGESDYLYQIEAVSRAAIEKEQA